jgi:hypothetical protein
MKLVSMFTVAILLAGCSRIVMLETSNPENMEYRFIFGKMLLDYDAAEKGGADLWESNIEEQLNNVLKKDLVTNSCVVIPGSINFGEPGSQGAASVRCTNVIDFQKYGEVFDNNGFPLYIYKSTVN